MVIAYDFSRPPWASLSLAGPCRASPGLVPLFFFFFSPFPFSLLMCSKSPCNFQLKLLHRKSIFGPSGKVPFWLLFFQILIFFLSFFKKKFLLCFSFLKVFVCFPFKMFLERGGSVTMTRKQGGGVLAETGPKLAFSMWPTLRTHAADASLTLNPEVERYCIFLRIKGSWPNSAHPSLQFNHLPASLRPLAPPSFSFSFSFSFLGCSNLCFFGLNCLTMSN